MDENQPKPDKLPQQAAEEETKQNQGKLKIFFGYAAGVGKTYAMLQSAHMMLESGVDVVAGHIEPHARPETIGLMEGLELLPPDLVTYKGIEIKEFDLDGALERKPDLILIDELAHTNAPACRHVKRYQDIQELIKAGIDVYTTVNVQHLESLNDIVASIIGIAVQERIPDFVFDEAAQVELVDIEPEELLERLKEGKIYQKRTVGRSMENFFAIGNLTALREIALRRTADQVNQMTEKAREADLESDFYTGEHILVCLSASPSNAKVIRSASRMSKAFKGRFSAVYVEVPGTDRLKDDDTMRLRLNQRLSEQLGAKTVILYGGDITQQIAEYARVSGVSKIVLGRSYTKRNIFSKTVNFSEQLTQLVPNLEIYQIEGGSLLKDMAVMVGVLTIATLTSFLFRSWGFDESNIITVYILGVLLAALITENQVYSFLTSVASVLCFNFFFTAPFWSLMVNQPSYFITFFIMFISGFITALLAKKVKTYGKQAVRRAWRMEILLETSQKLQMASDKEQIAAAVSRQLVKLLQKDIVYYMENAQSVAEPLAFSQQRNSCVQELFEKEEVAVAAWAYKNNKHAGATTGTLPGAKGLYLALRSSTKVYGVVGIYMGTEFLSAFDESLLNAMLNEAALALEKEENMQEKNSARIQMKQEQLRANLLRSISHDLRTPLTSISGNSGMLMDRGISLLRNRNSHCMKISMMIPFGFTIWWRTCYL